MVGLKDRTTLDTNAVNSGMLKGKDGTMAWCSRLTDNMLVYFFALDCDTSGMGYWNECGTFFSN